MAGNFALFLNISIIVKTQLSGHCELLLYMVIDKIDVILHQRILLFNKLHEQIARNISINYNKEQCTIISPAHLSNIKLAP